MQPFAFVAQSEFIVWKGEIEENKRRLHWWIQCGFPHNRKWGYTQQWGQLVALIDSQRKMIRDNWKLRTQCPKSLIVTCTASA
jgi:hypothetical protein